jgi:anti-sigma regulatory factor (Ser/Thr protein kinase)
LTVARLIDAAIDPRREAAREARKLVSGLRDPALKTVLDDLALLVSELVTNSFRYSGSKSDPISLRLSFSDGTVRAEVVDAGRGTTVPEPRKPSADGGWGLHIVSRTADRWGTELRVDGTAVWFEIDVDGERDA